MAGFGFAKAFSHMSPDMKKLLEGSICYKAITATISWYCGMAYLQSGGDVPSLVRIGLLYVVAIAAGYSGGGVLLPRLGLSTTRATFGLAFSASAAAPAAFLLLDPPFGPLAFAVLHGFGHGCYYLSWHAHLLRHSEDEDRDAFMAASMAISQVWQIAFPLAAWLGFAAATKASAGAGAVLLSILSAAGASGALATLRLAPTSFPKPNPRRVLALLASRRRLGANVWAGLLRVDAAEAYILSSIVAASILGGLPDLAELQIAAGAFGLLVSAAAVGRAKAEGRRSSLLWGAAGMAAAAVLLPMAGQAGFAALGLLLALRSAAQFLWGTSTAALECSLGADPDPRSALEAMIARDTSVGIGRCLFFLALAGLSVPISDPKDFAVVGFGLLAACYLLSALLTERVFFQSPSAAGVGKGRGEAPAGGDEVGDGGAAGGSARAGSARAGSTPAFALGSAENRHGR